MSIFKKSSKSMMIVIIVAKDLKIRTLGINSTLTQCYDVLRSTTKVVIISILREHFGKDRICKDKGNEYDDLCSL
jgi:hypothetical protein